MTAIGFRELIVVMVLLAVLSILVVPAIWFAVRRSRRSRPAGERLADLESLRQAGRINTDEYDRQRAAIISSI